MIGGRYYGDDSSGLLSDCEKYLIEEKRWASIPAMNHKRCTAFTFVWNKKIYVLGGYTGPFQRSTKI